MRLLSLLVLATWAVMALALPSSVAQDDNINKGNSARGHNPCVVRCIREVSCCSLQGFLRICSTMLTIGTTVCVVATSIQIRYFERMEGALPAEYLQRKAFPSTRTLPDRPIC